MLIGVSGGSGSHAQQLVAEHIRTDIGFVMFQIRTTKIINAKGISRAEFSLEDVVILLASIAQVTKSVKKCSTLWLWLLFLFVVFSCTLYIFKSTACGADGMNGNPVPWHVVEEARRGQGNAFGQTQTTRVNIAILMVLTVFNLGNVGETHVQVRIEKSKFNIEVLKKYSLRTF